MLISSCLSLEEELELGRGRDECDFSEWCREIGDGRLGSRATLLERLCVWECQHMMLTIVGGRACVENIPP